DSPWQAEQFWRKTSAPRASDGGRDGIGSSVPMRLINASAARATESGGARRSSNSAIWVSPLSAPRRTAAGSAGISNRACWMKSFASVTSSGRRREYSLAARAAAATTRRAAAKESTACPARDVAKQAVRARIVLKKRTREY